MRGADDASSPPPAHVVGQNGNGERHDAIGAMPTGKRPDATLADALSPQMGLGFDVEVVGAKPPGLADKFVAPPFSVLDTRAGYWQDRRRAWLSIGFRGETTAEAAADRKAYGTTEAQHRAHGQGEAVVFHDGGMGATGRAAGMVYGATAPGGDPAFYDKKAAVEERLGRRISTEEFQRDHYEGRAGIGASESVKTGTSVFDPVLCEVGYRWFSGEGAQVLDPFAGGVVRGAVAAILGRRYWGCELRPEQIADNRRQAEALFGEGGPDFGREPEMPVWHEGDATRLGEYSPPRADLVFTCPPYADLEVYSDDPRDLSTMPYAKFRNGLMDAMEASTEALRDNRFSVWVVGECRGKDGMEYGFVADTVKMAQACGMKPYNSAILLNSVGSAALRAQMILRSRKLTRVHQHVLVFVKGDPKKAAAACGSAEVQA